MKRLFLRQAIIFSSTILIAIPIQAMKDKKSAIATINQAIEVTFGKDPSQYHPFPYLWTRNINWSQWDGMLKKIDQFVATNSKDLLKKQDPHILNYYKTLKDANYRLQNMIKLMYNKYLANNKIPTRNEHQTAIELIAKETSLIIGMMDVAAKNPNLLKLQKDLLTLASKKNCIAVLNDFKSRLETIAKVANQLAPTWQEQSSAAMP
jgi:hypothetical protein